MHKEFLKWLSEYLEADEEETNKLLNNELARYFLIIWSIYEAKCFKGFVKVDKFNDFVEGIVGIIDTSRINDSAKYFHKRYQYNKKYQNLIHKNRCSRFSEILKKEYTDLTVEKKIFLLTFVTYRYRNNIFHGNKGISSWLEYDEQIKKCIYVLQEFINASSTGGNH